MLSIARYENTPEALARFGTAGRHVNDALGRDEPMFGEDPDLWLMIATRGGVPVGRVCAFVNPLLGDEVDAIGLLGWYECVDDFETSCGLLDAACEALAARGCTRVIGPINGDTWHRYRVALPGDEPPFFLDLESPPCHSDQWLDAEFDPIAEYLSAEIAVGSVDTDRIERESAEYRERGVVIRAIDMAKIEQELETIHRIATASFDRNFLYTPISFAQFLELYRPILPVVDPELVELAFDAEGAPVAFCFALPDLLAPAGSRVIAKTAGRVRRDDLRGLGSLMIERVHVNARRRGATSVVHALMHQSNRSRDVLGEHAREIRRYELYGKDL
jgi:hypothetical protein